MRYIKEFNQYEKIDEKIKFWDVALYLSLLYTSYNTVSNFREINKLYTIVNSASYNGTPDQKHQIDSLKKNIIEQIKISPKYNKDIKSYILDSLQNITIKFADPTGKNILKATTGALYMNLSIFKKHLDKNIIYSTFNISKTSKENIIIVNKLYENDSDLANMLIHEIYHYVDALLGQKNNLSKELNLSQFIDQNIKDDNENYISRKYAAIFGKKFNEISPKSQELFKELSNTTIDMIKYLKSPEELFVRWKTFKSYMVQKGYIKDMNSPVNTDLLMTYISNIKHQNSQDLEFLLIIDWDKIEELDNVSM